MVTREHSEPRILRHPRVGRARLAIEQGHFSKKIAAFQFGKRNLVSVLGSHADTDLPFLDYIHRVPYVPRAEENRTCLGIEAFEQLAQFIGRLRIERLKEWHLT